MNVGDKVYVDIPAGLSQGDGVIWCEATILNFSGESLELLCEGRRLRKSIRNIRGKMIIDYINVATNHMEKLLNSIDTDKFSISIMEILEQIKHEDMMFNLINGSILNCITNITDEVITSAVEDNFNDILSDVDDLLKYKFNKSLIY